MTPYRVPAGIAVALLFLIGGLSDGSTPTSEIHPIVEMGEKCLIGGVRDQKWIVSSRFQKTIKSPQNFTLFPLQGSPRELVLTRNSESECHDAWAAKSVSGLKDGIAIQSPSWNVMPRLPKVIDPTDPTYVQIVGGILKAAGIRNPEVKITQAYTIDLDGDGNQEVVIVANRFAKGLRRNSGIATQTSPGDYTLVLVRKNIDDKVQNIFLVKAVWPKGDENILPRVNHISAIADLNGDDVMELVLSSAYHEGSGSDVIQLKGSKPAVVLSCSCEH